MMELMMAAFVQKKEKIFLRNMLLRYILAAALGIGLSSCLFLPTIFALMEGKGGIGLGGLSLGLLGNPLNLISNLTISAKSSQGSVSLYTGSFAVIGCIAYFLSSKKGTAEKRIHALLAVLVAMIFYFGPLCFIFSLFRSVGSYWYRYSYIGSFTIIYFAGYFYSRWGEESDEVVSKNILRAGFGVALALLLLDYADSSFPFKYTSLTVLVYLFIACILAASRTFAFIQFFKQTCAICLVLAVMADLGANTYLLAKAYRVTNIAKDISYIQEESALINDLKHFDGSFYRVNQTLTRHQRDEKLTANYNEAAAYGYASISGYTSAPENIQLDFLDHLGYRTNGAAMNIVNTSILPADALLGVKYILTDVEIPGLKRIEGIPRRNGKQVYENPFCLPLAFTYSGSDKKNESGEDNPFLYLNARFSKLAGREVNIFSPVPFDEEIDHDGITYRLKNTLGPSAALYGNIPTTKDLNAKLYIDDEFQTGYSKWLAPSVFYIPQGDHEEIHIRLQTDGNLDSIRDVQFYALDLELLEQLTKEISRSAAENISIANGKISGTVTAKEGELLYLSVPYHRQWKILRNGESIEPVLFGNCLISIPLENGENIIEMTYSVRSLGAGICISLLSLIILVGLWKRSLHP